MNTAIDQDLLYTLSAQAAALPRKRTHLNFHTDSHAQCHRLLIAIEPHSYIRPHCHANHEKDETLLVLKGHLGLIYFDNSGTVTDTFILSPHETIGITIPHGQLHSVVALTSGTIFLKVRQAPIILHSLMKLRILLLLKTRQTLIATFKHYLNYLITNS
ncbi:hypothetical protein A0O36_02888 [Piscirickettsiaceae bacterium NZ-RLO1]|nr:hypothetical protein A0O36_02888 [Piscirickettsiaceae bacterium NZ-RLO1]